MSSERSSSILPALKEVQLITAEALLHPITLFASLKKLEIDLEIVQLEAGTTWLHLEDLRLRGILNISGLESFVARHKHLRHMHLAAVSILRPLDSEPGLIHKLLRFALETRLRSDLVSSIMEHVTKHASGHERSLFQCLYIRLDNVATKKTVGDLRRKIIEGYGEIMRLDLDKYCEEIGRMHILSASAASQLELSVSIEAFWEDQLAIKGMTSTVKSEYGQWVNNKVDEIPRIFYAFTERTR